MIEKIKSVCKNWAYQIITSLIFIVVLIGLFVLLADTSFPEQKIYQLFVVTTIINNEGDVVAGQTNVLTFPSFKGMTEGMTAIDNMRTEHIKITTRPIY